MTYPEKFFSSREFKEIEPTLERAFGEYSFYEVFAKITVSELCVEMADLINKNDETFKLNHNQIEWLDLFNGMMINHQKFELDHSRGRQTGRTVFLVALAKLLHNRGLKVVLLVRNTNEVRRLTFCHLLRVNIQGSYGDIDVMGYDGQHDKLSKYEVILIDDWEYFECTHSSGLQKNNSNPQVIFSLSCNKFFETLSNITGK